MKTIHTRFLALTVAGASLGVAGCSVEQGAVDQFEQLPSVAAEDNPAQELESALGDMAINESATAYKQAERLDVDQIDDRISSPDLLPGEVYCSPFDDWHRPVERRTPDGVAYSGFVCWEWVV